MRYLLLYLSSFFQLLSVVVSRPSELQGQRLTLEPIHRLHAYFILLTEYGHWIYQLNISEKQNPYRQWAKNCSGQSYLREVAADV